MPVQENSSIGVFGLPGRQLAECAGGDGSTGRLCGRSRLPAIMRYNARMAKTVIVKLTDDLDGSAAEETVTFGLDGKSFEIDLSKRNANALRKLLQPYIEQSRHVGRSAARGRQPRGATGRSATTTLFSQLDAEEKDRFRAWADMPTARRIGDSRVQEWIDAGKP